MPLKSLLIELQYDGTTSILYLSTTSAPPIDTLPECTNWIYYGSRAHFQWHVRVTFGAQTNFPLLCARFPPHRMNEANLVRTVFFYMPRD